jgi:hypothetical protein
LLEHASPLAEGRRIFHAPFIGPMTIGAPRPNNKDGSRGDTGIG